jgi:amino acid transporter
MSESADELQSASALRRRLGLPLLVLYGTGITVGAGIYVLIGAVARHAGPYAPWSFLLAAVVMGLTVASYAEMSTRYAVSAGEAAYVRAAFGSRLLSTLTGLLTLATGVVASAAVALGSSGYLREFVDLPTPLIVVTVVVVLGGVAAWGILESVLIASLFTLVEVGGLVLIIVAGAHSGVPFVHALVTAPPLEAGPLSGIAFASLLAFFAFVGFEDLANVVEEARSPHRDIPRAMILTLVITSALYVLVASVAVTAVSPDQLGASAAPLGLVYRTVAGINPSTFNAIAVVATFNTILAQMTMAARVIYGMARQGDLPDFAGHVHRKTRTPLVATTIVVVSIMALALTFPLERLAETTSIATLATFAAVNLSLLRIKLARIPSDSPHVRVPIWFPALGLIACVAMIAAALLADG